MSAGFLVGCVCLILTGFLQYFGLLLLAVGNLTQDVSFLIPVAVWSSLPQFSVGFASGYLAKHLDLSERIAIAVGLVSLVIAGIVGFLIVSTLPIVDSSIETARPIQNQLGLKAIIASGVGILLSVIVLFGISRLKRITQH